MAKAELIRERRKKLENIRKKGINPYPAEATRTHRAAEAIDSFEKLRKSSKKIYLIHSRLVLKV